MGYENDEFQYAECHFCGQERKCFIQVESGEEQIVCPICLFTGDYD